MLNPMCHLAHALIPTSPNADLNDVRPAVCNATPTEEIIA